MKLLHMFTKTIQSITAKLFSHNYHRTVIFYLICESHFKVMTQARSKAQVNMVHRDAVHCETVKKELKSAVIYQDFTLNPHSLRKNMNIVSSKPNSLRDALADEEEGDRTVIDVIRRYEQPPTQKYKFPMTESQEIGFITTPLLKHDKDDVRLYHHRRQTDVTESKEAEWKLVEQTKKMR